MKQLLNEFKAFVLKGNVIDLAVGVIIGAGFKTIVDSVVKDVITPVVNLIKSGGDHPMLIVDGVGSFIGAILNFLMLAAIVFFVFVKPMNKLMTLSQKKDEKPAEPPPTPEDIKLLTEIRDLLKK